MRKLLITYTCLVQLQKISFPIQVLCEQSEWKKREIQNIFAMSEMREIDLCMCIFYTDIQPNHDTFKKNFYYSKGLEYCYYYLE